MIAFGVVRYSSVVNTPHKMLVAFCVRVSRVCRRNTEEWMADNKFLTAEEVSERYRGEITVGTLRNWRAMRIGPPFVKIGKAVLYPVTELDAWDQKNTVSCRASRRPTMAQREEA
jgi:hypothetical protein